MNRFIRFLIIAVAVVINLQLTSCGCYEPDYTYTGNNIGQLQGPSVSRDSAEYRQKYSTLERYDQTVTITVAVCQPGLESDVKIGTTPENQTFNKIAKDVLNIELKYVVVGDSTAYDQKLNLYLASGRMPDMFFTNNSALYAQLLEDGALADLSDTFWYLNDELQENYLTHFPDLLPTVMEDSKLYAFPEIKNKYTSAQRLYVRQDWLDIVGMEAPTTMDEFLAVGQAFVDNKDKIAAATGIDAKRVIPFTMNKELTWAGSYSAEGFLNCFGTSVNAYFDDGSGNLYYSNTSPAMKSALSTLRHMYSAGILDKEFISKNAEMIQANIKSGYVGMVFGEWWMAKDVLDDCISNKDGSNWTWVNIPSASGVDAKPIVKSVGVGGYNLVSKDCAHPEAAARLINLFYDIYYSDDAQARYGDAVLPSNGFYYQYVPIKLWDGISSIREYKRAQEVFDNLYNAGFNPANYVDPTTYANNGILQDVSVALPTDYVVGSDATTKVVTIINRDVISAIEANPTWKAEFNKLRTREKTLHFADGYAYFYAYKQGKKVTEMTKGERRGWGIYHEMIDPTGGYSYVVDLTEGRETAKYDRFYGANLSAMTEYLEYISTQTNIIFTKMIKGDINVNQFESDYVQSVFNNNGGDKIMTQVNEWYQVNNQELDYNYIYALVK